MQLSQTVAAKRLGIDSTRLASYEHARVPIRFGFAEKFASTFNVRWGWLAEGTSPKLHYCKIPREKRSILQSEALFSEVWKEHLRPMFSESEREMLQQAIAIASKPPPALPSEKETRDLLLSVQERIKTKFESMDRSMRWSFIKSLHVSISEFLTESQFPQEPDDDWQESENFGIDEITASDNNADVKSPMKNLLWRLNRATAERGMKSKLAKVMGVPLANVSQWLSGEREPGGETTLKLLDWVDQQERHQK
ncbi:MAG TPA: helix-turn-helix transcriptional regulator [Verrucomicrobiae bacterium]|nr:helix-turn-helix transcriptional regulator [Verrucomicrobiae bacterium]